MLSHSNLSISSFLAAVLLGTFLITVQNVELHAQCKQGKCNGCPYSIDGVCTPSRQFGYFPTTWKRWPSITNLRSGVAADSAGLPTNQIPVDIDEADISPKSRELRGSPPTENSLSPKPIDEDATNDPFVDDPLSLRPLEIPTEQGFAKGRIGYVNTNVFVPLAPSSEMLEPAPIPVEKAPPATSTGDVKNAGVDLRQAKAASFSTGTVMLKGTTYPLNRTDRTVRPASVTRSTLAPQKINPLRFRTSVTEVTESIARKRTTDIQSKVNKKIVSDQHNPLRSR